MLSNRPGNVNTEEIEQKIAKITARQSRNQSIRAVH